MYVLMRDASMHAHIGLERVLWVTPFNQTVWPVRQQLSQLVLGNPATPNYT